MPVTDGVICLTSRPDAWFSGLLATKSIPVTYVDSAAAVLRDDPVDCILVHDEADVDARSVIETLAAERPAVPVVYLLDVNDAERIEAALDAGADEYATADVPSILPRRIRRLVGESDQTRAVDSRALTGETRVERDAQLLEEFLDSLLSETGDTVYFKDRESRFVRVSRSKAREVGRSRAEIRGKSDFDFMPAEKARQRYEVEQRIIETGESIRDDEERIVTADGDVRWLQSKKVPWYNAEGDIVGTFGISRDITDLKALEERLAELEDVIDRVPVWLLAVDGDGTVTWVNDAASSAFVCTENDLVGETIAGLTGDGPLEDAFLDQYDSSIANLLEGTDDTATDVVPGVPVRPPDGDQRICDVHVRLLPPADSEFRGTVVAFHDVTEQVEQERVLQRQYERLERLVETISHDLRNPLLVATGKVELAATTVEHEALGDAMSALERMETLIEELLTMAREGRTVEDPPTVSVEEVARRAWRPFEPSPASLAVESDAAIRADPDRLVRLFENLFRNASEHGRDDVSVWVGATDDGFFVADDGPGIAEEDRDRVFEHGFTTADDGTGLGLSIVAEIVSAHHWSIEVSESEHGGTCFDVLTTP